MAARAEEAYIWRTESSEAHNEPGTGPSLRRDHSASATPPGNVEDFEQDIADYLQAEAERLERRDVLTYLAEQAREGELWSISRLLIGLAQPTGDHRQREPLA